MSLLAPSWSGPPLTCTPQRGVLAVRSDAQARVNRLNRTSALRREPADVQTAPQPPCGVADNGFCGAAERIQLDLGEPFNPGALYAFYPDNQLCLRVLATYMSIPVGRCEKPRVSVQNSSKAPAPRGARYRVMAVLIRPARAVCPYPSVLGAPMRQRRRRRWANDERSQLKSLVIAVGLVAIGARAPNQAARRPKRF